MTDRKAGEICGKVYSSKIFDFTPENTNLPVNTIKGGTGYDIFSALPDCIDKMFPDYSIGKGKLDFSDREKP